MTMVRTYKWGRGIRAPLQEMKFSLALVIYHPLPDAQAPYTSPLDTDGNRLLPKADVFPVEIQVSDRRWMEEGLAQPHPLYDPLSRWQLWRLDYQGGWHPATEPGMRSC